MTQLRVNAWINMDRHPGGEDIEWVVEKGPQWWELADFLDRLRTARIIDDWESKEVIPDPADSDTALLQYLEQTWREKLENVESGYEQPYDDGGDSPGYRRDMIDAGRGHLLR